MKVYVASAFEDYRRTRSVQRQLVDSGLIEISHNWTVEADVKASGAGTSGERLEHANADYWGVLGADVVMLLTPDDKAKGCGCWVEVGIALGTRKIVVISGPQRDRSIFCEMAVRFEHDSDAVLAVIAEARAQGKARARWEAAGAPRVGDGIRSELAADDHEADTLPGDGG